MDKAIRDFSYQNPLIEKAFENLIQHKKSLLAACPGAGKTNMAIEIIKKFLKKYPEKKVLILTHGQIILREQFKNRMIELKKNDKFDDRKIMISLPQTIVKNCDQLNPDLIVIDEAHHFYTGKMIKEIFKKTGATYELLLTGTPSKFIDEMPIVYITLSELIEKEVLSDISLVLEKFSLSIGPQDYDKNKEVSVSKILEGSSRESLNLIFDKNDISIFKKTMVICRSQKQAKEIETYLKSKGMKVVISTSDYCDDSEKTFSEFKRDGQFLIVVNRGILGFDYPNLTSVIDLSLTLNISRIFQQVCRVVRKTNDKKFYFKVYSDKAEEMTKGTLLAVMSMAFEEGYLTKYDSIKPINPPKEMIKEAKIFENGEISFTDFKILLETSKIMAFREQPPLMTLEKALFIMRQYSTYREFKDNNIYAYKHIISKAPEKLRAYFKDCPVIRNWTVEKAREEANKYSTRQDFKNAYIGAYKYLLANDREWLDNKFINLFAKACHNMPQRKIISNGKEIRYKNTN